MKPFVRQEWRILKHDKFHKLLLSICIHASVHSNAVFWHDYFIVPVLDNKPRGFICTYKITLRPILFSSR